ncbi:MAG: DUF4428 domain-containing protein [Nitrososphaeraceae archaeon]
MPTDTKCSICNNPISLFRYKAMKQWNILEYLCNDCYSKKLKEHYFSKKENSNYNKKTD